MAENVCAAHSLLVENVNHLRGNQSEMYNLIRDLNETVNENNVQTKENFAQVKTWQISFESAQKKQNEETNIMLNKILTSMNRKKWTTGKIIALITSITGSGGLVYAVVMYILQGGKTP